MQLFNDSKGYANYKNAERALLNAQARFCELHRSYKPVRWMVSVNANGRYVPVVMLDSPDHMFFIHNYPNIAVAK
jgi:hypothetical protein